MNRGAFGVPGSSSSVANKDRKLQLAKQLVLDLSNPDVRENALHALSKKRELFQDLAPLLWNSVGTIAALLQEIVSIYPLLSPPILSPVQSDRVCNALALLQCVASHPDTRMLFLNAHIHQYVYPFIKTTDESKHFDKLRHASLWVIGALVMVDDTKVIRFLSSTETVHPCLCVMERGDVLSKTVAVFVLQKILSDEDSLNDICTTTEGFFPVGRVLAKMVAALPKQPPLQLLKHIIQCYLLLSDNIRACEGLKSCLPDKLRDAVFRSCLREDPNTRKWLQQLFIRVQGPRFAFQAGGAYEHTLVH